MKLTGTALAALVIMVQAAAAQHARGPNAAAPRTGAPGTFRSGIDLVALAVTVTDGEHEFVTGLRASDFVVYEEGVRQPIAYFAASDAPLDLAIVVDASASMAMHLGLVRQSAGALVETLRAGDRASVVEIRNTVAVPQSMTANLQDVRRAIEQLAARGGTALREALYVTLSDLAERQAREGDVRRRAIVVLSDGLDTRSLVSFEHVLDRARRSGVAVYVVALRSDLQDEEAGGKYSPETFELRRLASESGGRAFFPKRADEIRVIYRLIGEELSSQYALGYVPPRGRVDEWRTVQVRLPGHEGLEPRTRAGYFVSPGTPSDQQADRGNAR